VGASPTRQPLQPEAIEAVVEVTKWLKPSISVSRIGDSASVQAATRVRRLVLPSVAPFKGPDIESVAPAAGSAAAPHADGRYHQRFWSIGINGLGGAS
jgi:hypothetical protein